MGGAVSVDATEDACDDALGAPPTGTMVPQLGREDTSVDATVAGSEMLAGSQMVRRRNRRRRSTVAALNLWSGKASSVQGGKVAKGLPAADQQAAVMASASGGATSGISAALRETEEKEISTALKFLGEQHAAANLNRASFHGGGMPLAALQAAEKQTAGIEQVMNLIARLSQPAPALAGGAGGETGQAGWQNEVASWNEHLRSLFAEVAADRMGGDQQTAHSVQSYLVRQFVSDGDRMDLNEAADISRQARRSSRSDLDQLPEQYSKSRKKFSQSFVHQKRSYGKGISASTEDRFKKLQLAALTQWSFDTNEVEELTKGKAITFMGHTLLQQHDLLKCPELKLQPETLDHFLAAIEAAYKPNPYHNAVHGADAAQTLNSFLRAGLMSAAQMDTVDIFAAVLAALVHDVGHPGVNADWLKATDDDLALTYNDVSPLENMHISTAFKIAKGEDKCNIFRNMSKADYKGARHLMVQMVLGTDMATHFGDQLEYRRKVVEIRDGEGGQGEGGSASSRVMQLRMALHIADISNISKEREISNAWTDRLMKEFYAQGDREREAGRAISPMCDRTSTNIPKSQVGFIDVIVRPSFELWFQMKDVTQNWTGMQDHVMGLLDANRAYWVEEGEKQEQVEVTQDAPAAMSLTVNKLDSVGEDEQGAADSNET